MSTVVAQISRTGVAGSKANIGLGPLSWAWSAWTNRLLIARLTRRSIESRYRGSLLGIFWALAIPILLLAVYTFVFSVVFQARWETAINNRGQFALILFCGLIVYNVFAESINRSPALMLHNLTYIKKVVFPLEILPWVNLLSALFNAAISAVVLLLGYFLILGVPPLSVLLVPIVMLPLLFFTLGLSLFLASVGVFLRDLEHVVGVVTMVLMFITPIFFPLSAIPEWFREIVQWSPLSVAVETARGLLFGGPPIKLGLWIGYLLSSWAVAWLGFVWFQKTKKGFADVV